MGWLFAAIDALRRAARATWQFVFGFGAGVIGALALAANPPRPPDPGEETLALVSEFVAAQAAAETAEERLLERTGQIDTMGLRGALADRMLGLEPDFVASVEPHHRRWIRVLDEREASELLDLDDAELANRAVGLVATSAPGPRYTLGDVVKRERRAREETNEAFVAASFGLHPDDEYRPPRM